MPPAKARARPSQPPPMAVSTAPFPTGAVKGFLGGALQIPQPIAVAVRSKHAEWLYQLALFQQGAVKVSGEDRGALVGQRRHRIIGLRTQLRASDDAIGLERHAGSLEPDFPPGIV